MMTSMSSKAGSHSAAAAAPAYLEFFKKVGEPLTLSDGTLCDAWELTVPIDSPCVSEWARSFRQAYCLDTEIDVLRGGTGLSRSEYLINLVFPDKSEAPGPSIRAGDFAELLIADYVEHLLGYWVPRGKYAEKASRNESVKGVDIMGFKVVDPAHPKSSDSLLAFEVKAQLSGGKYDNRLQIAIDDSAKDYLRSAQTLAALKRRLHVAGKTQEMLVVQRFQNLVDRPYEFGSGAAAILSGEAFDLEGIKATKPAGHNNVAKLKVIVVTGKDLMALAHALYQRAADEA